MCLLESSAFIRWLVISLTRECSISIYGLLFQSAGLALASPAYLLLYVFTSPTVTTPSLSNISVDPTVLSGIPFALALGLIPPSVFMCLPSPDIISPETKIKAIALWQPVPVYVTSLLYLWTVFSGSSSTSKSSQINQIKKLRTIYKIGLAAAVPIHAAAWAFSLVAVIFPQIYTPTVAAAFHPLAAIIPANPFTYATTTVSSMVQGSHNFLQWDFIVSSTAYLVFSLNARFNARVEPKGFSAVDAAGLVTRIGVLGPVGTALSYLWERDEIVLGREEGSKKLH
jgi:hypothetical protein